MADYFEIRADYNQHTITVYQAYNDAIADVAVRNGRFGAPFSFNRMTWIKPSFMWMMERSNWGLKKINNAFSQSESNAPSLIHCWNNRC